MSYKAEIIADSTNQQGNRITTFVVTYPRIVHAEMCRHRMHSRNTASSRAIPFKKMVKDVEENPFIPLAWQKDHKGMQGSEYWSGKEVEFLKYDWLRARDTAVHWAKYLDNDGITKQLCNRLLEPFVWTTEIITATEWDNFFNLRCPQYKYKGRFFKSKKDWLAKTKKHFQWNGLSQNEAIKKNEFWWSINKSQADIHIQAIAELMWDAYNASTPKELQAGEWHIPFGDNLSDNKLDMWFKEPYSNEEVEQFKVKIATARCARISYKNFEGKDDYEADIKLHVRLASMKHWSPFEHCAKAMSDEEYSLYRVESPDNNELGMCRNFKGFIPYRHLIEE